MVDLVNCMMDDRAEIEARCEERADRELHRRCADGYVLYIIYHTDEAQMAAPKRWDNALLQPSKAYMNRF